MSETPDFVDTFPSRPAPLAPPPAATDVGAEDSREPSPVITGLLWALALTALCLLAAHFLARVWP